MQRGFWRLGFASAPAAGALWTEPLPGWGRAGLFLAAGARETD